MENLTEELGFDRVNDCNEIKHYKNQINITNLSTPKGSKKDFVIFHQNIRDLSNNKLDELFVSLSANPPHIICLTDIIIILFHIQADPFSTGHITIGYRMRHE
jgi:hypothetical protein